ncbi:MAG TPA: ammonium transporter [Thermodesulfobacteriota bacterium]|nr:ammonium transporter [Thermodesulfobacteriota bacterium]
MKRTKWIFMGMALLWATSTAFAGEKETAAKINPADTAWLLMSAALVMLMTPGLALFYGGMVRSKNVLGTIMQSFMVMALISVQWVLFGYSLAFGPTVNGFIGNLSWFGLQGVGLAPNPDYAETVPHQAFMIYQAMFAVITPALLLGAIAERMKFKAFFFFTLLWSTLVYDPIAHWVWGAGGWIRQMGGLDFAGGIVVHISSGVAALVAALVMGKRKGFGTEAMAPHSLPMTIAGAGILWFGWFGFNAGSAITAGVLSTSAFVVTHIAGAAGALSWSVVEWIYKGRATTLGAVSGGVAGLATITPASGYVAPWAALAIGFTAGILCYWAVMAKNRFGYDDSLDVVGIHGVGGTLGALAIGFFATKGVNEMGNNGLIFGNADLIGIQAAAVLSAWVYSFAVTFIILKILDWTIGLRVSHEEEESGLDLTQHAETGYNF